MKKVVLLLVLCLMATACEPGGWWNGMVHSGGHGAVHPGKG